jgi:hypothetical protein
MRTLTQDSSTIKDVEAKKAIAQAWLLLSQKGTVQAKQVFNRLTKDNVDFIGLKSEEAKKQIESKGYYEVATEQSKEILSALDCLVSLGYLAKRRDTLFHVGFYYMAYPYVPNVSPLGSVGVAVETNIQSKQLELNSDQYKRFLESAKILKSEVLGGRHRHITQFDYGTLFSYDTDVYQTNPPFFDSLSLQFDDSKQSLRVDLTEPFVERKDKTDSKNWRRIGELPEEVFLSRPDEVRQTCESLNWKKKLIGILLVDGAAYFVPQPDRVEEVRAEMQRGPPVPSFLGEKVFAFENYMSRIFEDATADYLRKTFQYNATPRYKPEYLQDGEIDVFAEKGIMPKDITICECKLRFNEAPINIDELKGFEKKVVLAREKEGARGQIKFFFWFVTNAGALDADVRDYAAKTGIEIMHSTLSENWQRRSDWTVSRISKL